MAFTKETAAAAGKKSSRKEKPNKITPEIRGAFKMLVENNLEKMDGWLDRIAKEDPAKAFDIIAKLSEFVVPKLNRTEIDNTTSIERIFSMSPTEREAKIIELRNELRFKKIK